jgi:hypothetical protein
MRSLEEANAFLEEYLPIYNRRFSVSAKERGNLHRPLGRGLDLDAILCIKTERALRNDFTVAHNRKLYQVEDKVHTSKVMVEDRMDGSLHMTYKNRSLRFREIMERPITEKRPSSMMRIRKSSIPSTNHPWRGFKFGKHRYERGRPIEFQP